MVETFTILFLLLFTPNIFRHFAYYLVFRKKSSIEHIDSYETRIIYKSGKLPWKGVIEEIILGIVITYLWFNFSYLRFLAFGWLSDALLDVIYSSVFLAIGKTPLMFVAKDLKKRFILRELVIPYLILGPLLYSIFEIDTFALFTIASGAVNLFFIIFKKP